MNKEALDFIIYSIFGDMCNPVDAIISRAYVDMASHTMTGFNNVEEKWDCRYKASDEIKRALDALGTEDFDVWHDKICRNLIGVYSKRMSYGQAQSWM